MIVTLDTETTGTRRDVDRIVEIALLVEYDEPLVWRINPGVPIPAEASAVHGITDADVAGCPSFAQCAPIWLDRIRNAATIAGFNLRFDLEIIQSELDRAGLQPLDLSRVALIDAMRWWQSVEPRTLVAAHEKFVGGEFNAHSAGEDVRATKRVLDALAARYPQTDISVCDPMPDRHLWFGPTRHLTWDGEAVVVGFGKHEGRRLHEMDRGFLEWVISKDFPAHVKLACRAALAFPADEFLKRARARKAA